MDDRKIFFTADTHFWHTNIIKYCNRPFGSIEEMNDHLVTAWNETVSDSDLVYHLGDFGLGNADKMAAVRDSLNGRIFLVMGNHDCGITKKKWLDHIGMDEVYDFLNVSEFHLSHLSGGNFDEGREQDRSKESSKYFKRYSTVCDDRWRLCGHIHNHWKFKGRQLNVGVDVHNFRPISIDQIRQDIKDHESKSK